MASSKFPLPSPLFHSKHDFTFLLNSALSQPDFLEDFEKSSQGRTSGRWSKEEHHRFIEGLTKYGKNWKKVEEEEIVEVGNRENADLDLISDLKTLGNRNKEPMFLSIKEIEEKYRDFNLKKTG